VKDELGKQQAKFIFVTGGVISGVGKGITAASIGSLLKAQGLRVSMQKCDPYFNVDAGLLNPREHGECFVTADGAETDLDLGHYERFLDEEMTADSIWTSGKLFKKVIDEERAGKFRGRSVQLIPSVTREVQETFLDNARHFKSDAHIVEIGGTVGDLEGPHFVEAIREFPARVGRENCFYVHTLFVPYLSTSHEFKTKPAQNSLRDLREIGIIPDMVVARLDVAKLAKTQADEIKRKLSTFGGVDPAAVIILPNAPSVYEVPLNLATAGVVEILNKFTGVKKAPDLAKWEKLNARIQAKPQRTVRVGLVAKYIDNTDTYMSVVEALNAAAWQNAVGLEIVWISAEDLENGAPTKNDSDVLENLASDKSAKAWRQIREVDGIVVPGGFGARGLEGKILAADYALENDRPYLGLCLGMQAAVIAAARRGGLEKATSAEIDPDAPEKVIYIMNGQKGKESTGGTLRLGDYPAVLVKNSRAYQIYSYREVASDEAADDLTIVERHRHRYEVNQKFLPQIAAGGLTVSGTSPDGSLVEFVEAPGKKFFVATQAHPEFRSRPTRPHPLFVEFIKSLREKND
jgi:CTP synthase